MEQSIDSAIREELTKIFLEEGIAVPLLEKQTVLMESGLDSMAFAILVARLEMRFGIDPFSVNEEPTYPETLSDFIEFYEQTINRLS